MADDRTKVTELATALGGHVEIWWSHRPFCGPPEAKVYLDTPHARVPGYRQLDHTDEPAPYDQQSLIDRP